MKDSNRGNSKVLILVGLFVLEVLLEMIDAQTKSVGAAAIGGPFNLTDQNGKPFSSENLKNEFSVLYFGFTQCPDICPDELDKITEAIQSISTKRHIMYFIEKPGFREGYWSQNSVCVYYFGS